jgi:hypothetical protein
MWSLILLGGSINSETICRPNKKEKEKYAIFSLKLKGGNHVPTRDEVQNSSLYRINNNYLVSFFNRLNIVTEVKCSSRK